MGAPAPLKIRGFEQVVPAEMLPAIAAYIEYRTGGHCVIGRHDLGEDRLLLQIFTYLLPTGDIEQLEREVASMAGGGNIHLS